MSLLEDVGIASGRSSHSCPTAPFQLCLQIFRLGRPQKSETDSALTRFDDVVEAVRLDDTLHVSAFGEVAVIKALVDDDIVKTNVDCAISRDTCTNDCCPVPGCSTCPQYDHRRRWYCEDNEIKIVTFPKSLVWAVMIGV